MRNTMIYKESDWIAEVEVLENLSDDVFVRYRLKVIKTFSTHPCFESLPPNGSIFTCSKNIGQPDVHWVLEKKSHTEEVPR